ncbi:hypothetical protein DPMN_164270 [Dreissena polymorpha]|uniref:Uncharacterized protein n=1 Tax=Dreissena polymorpha TaxID=45954 RepID=A0A9D4EYD3_DREPO|nr:hypothetical protein DPMN_164270 [Dreissena polymorpha]
MDKNNSMEIAKAFWENEHKTVVAGFQSQYASCSSKEREYALEDLQNTDNITQLQKNNAERYHWAWNDVFVMDNEIPSVFRFIEVDQQQIVINNNKGKTKIVTYSKTKEPVSTFTANSLSQIVKMNIANGSEDAKEIAANVKEEMQKVNVVHSALLVYFNGEKYQPA